MSWSPHAPRTGDMVSWWDKSLNRTRFGHVSQVMEALDTIEVRLGNNKIVSLTPISTVHVEWIK